jgi:hypothetical protein
MSSACAVVIARGFELLRFEHSSIGHLAHIASGHYRLLPYAIEFWIDHCIQYASTGGSLGLDRSFQHHVARLHEKHKDCLHALACATTPIGTHNYNPTIHADHRLQLFADMPIYALMADVLSLRQLASQFDGDNNPGRLELNM